MKTIKLSFIFSMLLMCNQAFSQQISSAEIQVTGLTCSMCSQATEKSIRTLNYVGNVTPDLNKNVFMVSFKKDAAVNFDQINKKVKDAGFAIGKLDAIINFNQVKIDDQGQAVVGNNVYQFINAKNRILNGAVKVSVVDKNFISSKDFKQKMETVKFDSYASGTSTVSGKKTRIYHLSI